MAVSSSGVFFVSDGYCNKRILKFDADGRLLDVHTGSFHVPHSLALSEEKDALCVADRENSRVVCIHAGLNGDAKFGSPYGRTGHKGQNVGKVYAVAARGTEIKTGLGLLIYFAIPLIPRNVCVRLAGQQLYAVFQSIFLGMSDGKTLDLDTLSTVSRWTPSNVLKLQILQFPFVNCGSFALPFISRDLAVRTMWPYLATGRPCTSSKSDPTGSTSLPWNETALRRLLFVFLFPTYSFSDIIVIHFILKGLHVFSSIHVPSGKTLPSS